MKAFAVAILVLLAAPVSAAETAAPADATQQAKARFRKGAELYREARYREAVAEFEAAYRLRPHGVIFYNLAQCHERMGDIPAALRAYHEYLRAVPDADDRATVHAAMANLEARLGASGVQQLLVYSDPGGAEVFVDGQARGRTPFASVLPHGSHTLVLVKPGHVTVTREVVLTPDRSVELDFALKKGELASAPTPTATATPTALILTTPGPTPVPVPRHRVWTWVASGAAGIALASAVAYGLAARSASNDLRATEHNGATAQQLASTAASRSRNANILYGVAGAAGAAGTALFFVEGRF
jgi:hypothetical protein